MVIDTSAMFAAIAGESDSSLYRDAIMVVPFDEPMAEAAFEAFKRYGKGQGHKAQFNIIDCAAYALAKARNLPLLFKGNDFAATDVRPALPSRP
jgi:ribonuclease VapC